MKIPVKIEHSTSKQLSYIEILAIDLELDRKRRNAHVSEIVKRPIKYLDELTKVEASQVIDQFKQWKEKPFDLPEEAQNEIPYEDDIPF